MHRGQVRRLIYLSFLGVREGRQQLGGLLHFITPVMLRNAIADHEAKEVRKKQRPGLDHCPPPPKLTNGQWTGVYRHGPGHNRRNCADISRADVADFMLRPDLSASSPRCDGQITSSPAR